MPLLNTLATPYAEALLQVTDARSESDDVAAQCKELLALWDSSDSLREAMTSPVLEPAAKKKALTELLSEQVKPSLMNLLKVLADRQRLAAFDSVLRRFLELYRDSRNISLAHVRSAQALTEAQTASLTAKVQSMVGTGTVEIRPDHRPQPHRWLCREHRLSGHRCQPVWPGPTSGSCSRQGELIPFFFTPPLLLSRPFPGITRHGFHPS